MIYRTHDANNVQKPEWMHFMRHVFNIKYEENISRLMGDAVPSTGINDIFTCELAVFNAHSAAGAGAIEFESELDLLVFVLKWR